MHSSPLPVLYIFLLFTDFTLYLDVTVWLLLRSEMAISIDFGLKPLFTLSLRMTLAEDSGGGILVRGPPVRGVPFGCGASVGYGALVGLGSNGGVMVVV